ncbi:MAG: DUF6383 domain-containing protein [Parabacteroides sp.]|nr:DUF6383 domain-containing protein [Parabacteroides sp.]
MNDEGFNLSIDTEKGKKATIEGASAFSGVLAAQTAGASADNYWFRLKNDKKYVVVDLDATWGDNMGEGRGYKFALVDDPDKEGKHYLSFFNFSTYAGSTDKTVLTKAKVAAANTGADALTMFITSVGDKNYLTTVETLAKGEKTPYLALGNSTAVDLTTLLAAPAYYTVVKVNANGTPVKALGTALNNEGTYVGGFVDLGSVQLDQPEGQWAPSVVDGKLKLTNRENPFITKTFAKLLNTGETTTLRAASPIYTDGADNFVLTAVSAFTVKDGYVVSSVADMRDVEYTIGFYSNVYGETAYLAENHAGKHQLGLEKDLKSAATWKLIPKVGATDTVKIESTIYYYDASTSSWASKADYLKLIAYEIQNVANAEKLHYNVVEGVEAYYCSAANADRFLVKKAANGMYNLIRVIQDGAVWEVSDKVYAGFSANYGNIQLTNVENKTENDLVVLTEKAAPQYLLAFNPTFGSHSDNCNIPGLPAIESNAIDTVYGRFLVNLVDSAYANKDLHNNKYVNSEKLAKLGFVKGYHQADTLVIQREGAEKAAKADSIIISKIPTLATFAFKVVDQETKAFVIETGYKAFTLDAPATTITKGYLKWMNGYIVVVDKIENADVYNLKATDENPTANEAIEASQVTVIGGQGVVTVQGAAGKVITVANILGQTIANQVAASDNVTIAAPAGVVVVAVEGEATKVVVK